MTAREFNMLAMALYGPDYVRPIMRLLKVDRRTIQRYKAGTKPVDYRSPDHEPAHSARPFRASLPSARYQGPACIPAATAPPPSVPTVTAHSISTRISSMPPCNRRAASQETIAMAHDTARQRNPAEQAEGIRALNDAFRKSGGSGGRFMVTAGVQALGPIRVAALLRQVMTFGAFTEDNDPYGEHDFGSFKEGGKTFFWKIDAYDKSLEYGSPDPADPAVTTRVLTLMLAEEY